jgi:hypothetical protein
LLTRETRGAFVVDNSGQSYYDAATVELRRRFSRGLLVQANYTFGKAIANTYASSSAVFDQPNTLRNFNLRKGLAPFDITQSLKMNFIYELPVGRGQQFLRAQAVLLMDCSVAGASMATSESKVATRFRWVMFSSLEWTKKDYKKPSVSTEIQMVSSTFSRKTSGTTQLRPSIWVLSPGRLLGSRAQFLSSTPMVLPADSSSHRQGTVTAHRALDIFRALVRQM